MNECLITRLKRSIDDDSLKVIGVEKFYGKKNEWLLFVASGANKVIATAVNGTIEYIAEGGIRIDNNNAYISNVKDKGIQISTDDDYAIVSINNKYELTDCGGFIVPFNGYADLKYSKLNKLITYAREVPIPVDYMPVFDLRDLSEFINPQLVTEYSFMSNGSLRQKLIGDISNLSKFVNITKFEVDYSNISGDISVFSKMKNLKTLNLLNSNNVYGDISSIGNLTSLTSLNFIKGDIVGSLESFVAKQRLNGRTTNSTGIKIGFSIDNVTFNGAITVDKANRILTWTESTITFDGVTVTA